jgi:hypothetical protein
MAAYLGLGNQTNTQAVVKYGSLQVGTSQIDIPIPYLLGQRRINYNCVWFNHFVATPANAKGKGGSTKGEQQYTYTAAVVLAAGEGEVDSILNVWSGGSTTNTTTLSKLNLTFYNGSATQTPPPYITTNYPDEALSYALTAFFFSPKFSLGSSATVPDNAFEAIRANGFTDTLTTDGWTNPITLVNTPGTDFNMADIIPDVLTNVQYGMGFQSGDLPDLTVFRAYQRAQGLFFSVHQVNQEKATDLIDRYAKWANCFIYWGGAGFVIVPLGDSALSANGATYTPDLTPAYNLDLLDYVGSDGLKVTVTDPADASSRTRLEFCDRTLCYSTNTAEYTDTTLRDEVGLRDDSSTQADEICAPQVAQVVVQLIGKRLAWIRRQFTFKTSYRRIRLVPGSIITVTDTNQGINAVPVRILTVSQDANHTLSFTAEELVQGTGTYVPIAMDTVPITTLPSQTVDPGNVNTPAIVEPNSSYTGNKPQLLISASGNPATWGGCLTFVSFDGTDYQQVGTINAPAYQGVLTAPLAAYGGTNPDTGDTLAVDLAESGGVPGPVTNQDAQQWRTLSLIAAQPTPSGGFEVVPSNGELLAFGNVATTGTHTADLTYLYRGGYGTAAGAHSTGDQFTLLDVSGSKDTTVIFDLPAQYVGQPLYVKFASFNIFGQETQDLAACTAYQYTPSGAGYGGGTGGVPLVPTGLTASAGTGQNVITWNANASTDNVTFYRLYAASGLSQPFGSAILIWSGLATNYVHTGLVSGAEFTYFLSADNVIGDSGPTAGVNCTSGTFMPASSASLTVWMEGLGLDNEMLGETVTTQNITFTGYRFACHADVPPVSDATFNLWYRSFMPGTPVKFATVLVPAGSYTGSITFIPSSAVVIPVNSLISVNAPSPADVSLANVSFSFTAEPSP